MKRPGRRPSRLAALAPQDDGQQTSFSRCGAPEFCRQARRHKILCKPPQQKGKRSAERRIVKPMSARKTRLRAARLAARSPFGAHTCGTRHRFHPMAQLQNRVSRGVGWRVFCPFRTNAAAVKHAPCGPVFMPVDRGPKAARERIGKKNPSAGTAPRLRCYGMPSGTAHCTKRGILLSN